MSDSELADLLYELNHSDEEPGDFLVLPEDFKPPLTGIEGTYALLLIGVDNDRQGISGRSDTMVLAVMDTRAGSVKLISFMRDLYVRLSGRGNNRLNAAFAFGGPELLVKTLQDQFHVAIDGYLAVDFSTMAALVDAMGGVEMTVTPRELESLNGILEYYNQINGMDPGTGLLASGGTVRLNGMQAMAYARIRKIDSDFERVGRQQAMLKAIFRQLTTLDAARLMNLLAEQAARVKTNVSLKDAMELAVLSLAMDKADMAQLTIPVRGAYRNVMQNGSAFLVPNLKRNINAIAEFLGKPTD